MYKENIEREKRREAEEAARADEEKRRNRELEKEKQEQTKKPLYNQYSLKQLKEKEASVAKFNPPQSSSLDDISMEDIAELLEDEM